jgi:2-dehydropantoate 2-reductase
MLTKDSKIAMVGAGAIGGITAALIKQAGQDLEIVCKHQDLADKISNQGMHITGIKGEHRVKLKAVKTIAELSGPQDLVYLATKGTDCVAAARDLLP